MQVRNDLRSQGLEVPDAVARPAASPDLALAALREVENQPHAGRQHKTEEPEISDDDEDVEQEGDIGGRYEEEIMEVCSLVLPLAMFLVTAAIGIKPALKSQACLFGLKCQLNMLNTGSSVP